MVVARLRLYRRQIQSFYVVQTSISFLKNLVIWYINMMCVFWKHILLQLLSVLIYGNDMLN